MWIGNKPMPSEYIATWKAKHPGWLHILWNEDSIAEFGLKNQHQYDMMQELCGKKDIASYEILHKYGGFFLDADAICINPLDDLLNESFVVAYESEKARPGLIANGTIGCECGNEYMDEMVNRILAIKQFTQPAWKQVGPVLLTAVLNDMGCEQIMPSYAFTPHHFTGINSDISGKNYATQLWFSTKSHSKLNVKSMALKYRFKKEYNGVKVILKNDGVKTIVDSLNLTDELAETILSIPDRAHLIEQVPNYIEPQKKSALVSSTLAEQSASTSTEAETDGIELNTNAVAKESTLSESAQPTAEKKKPGRRRVER